MKGTSGSSGSPEALSNTSRENDAEDDPSSQGLGSKAPPPPAAAAEPKPKGNLFCADSPDTAELANGEAFSDGLDEKTVHVKKNKKNNFSIKAGGHSPPDCPSSPSTFA
ncbi:beta-synuclein isoform X5 [Thunnus maccoyii]|uniref:beta-synuclein isoform X5 n=1 Tax=Thunnus maccoyii TaxID=8240 RepID=UPI001C4DC62C|nr:beta-synuclein isoform X5 [Thunnus maccoyii]